MNFTSVTVFLCILSWISVSASEFHAVEVQAGEDVTLQCTNFSNVPSHIHWFRLGSKTNVTCVSSMMSSTANATFCDGFQNGRFTMTSNTVTIFLSIKQVDLSESGLYFCGSIFEGKSVIVHATYLKVAQEMFVELPELINTILAGVILFLIIVIVILVIKIRKHSAPGQGQNPQHSEILGSGDLNYAALSFKPKPKTNHRPASETHLGTDVVYAATR